MRRIIYAAFFGGAFWWNLNWLLMFARAGVSWATFGFMLNVAILVLGALGLFIVFAEENRERKARRTFQEIETELAAVQADIRRRQAELAVLLAALREPPHR